MANVLPVQAQAKPVVPDPQVPPKPNAPTMNLRTPQGTRPGQPTSPTRINLPPEAGRAAPAALPAAGAAVAEAGGLGLGLQIGITLPLTAALTFGFADPAAAPELMPPEAPQLIEQPPAPFRGGQNYVRYNAVYYDVEYAPFEGRAGKTIGGGRNYLYGPIQKVRFQSFPHNNPPYDTRTYIYITDLSGLEVLDQEVDSSNGKPYRGRVLFERVDGQPDISTDPSPTGTPIYSNPSTPLRIAQPQAPTAAPAPAIGQPQAPTAAPRRPRAQSFPQLQIQLPPPAATPTSQQLPGLQPIGQPQPIPIDQFSPLPFQEFAPRPGLNLVPPPYAEPTPSPPPTAEPNSNKLPAPTILISPGASPGPLTFIPNPSTGNPTPTPTTTPSTPERSPDPQRPPLEDIGKILGPMAIAIAGITALVQPNAIKNAAKSATCEAFAPGGCNDRVTQNADDAAKNSVNNSNKLDALNALMQAADLTLLKVMDKKLGKQLDRGGISGFLGRMSAYAGVDRALNLVSFASNLHNAMMLSASLKVTLLELLSSVGNATGLLQTSENENVDLNNVFNQGIENFLVLILGTENYAGLKVGLWKYSAIYRAANNVLSNVGNMFSSIGNGIEVIGERTGKIGNAIRAAGMVRENAYQWMSEKMTVHTNKFMTFQTKVGGVTEVLESINEIAESTIEGQQSYTEAVKATTDFKKVLAEGTKEEAKDAENKAIAKEAEKIKENISKDPTGEKDQGYLSFLTD